jgi:hypothetical protein
MLYFQTKNPNLKKFWSALEWKMFEYVMPIWNMLLMLTFGMFLWSFGNFVAFWYIFSRFGILYQQKSGNPELDGLTTCPESIVC